LPPAPEPTTSNLPPPTRTLVRQAIQRAWVQAVESGTLPVMPPDADQPAVEVARPTDPAHGDFATNLALKLARPLRRSPMEIAERLAEGLRAEANDVPAGPETEGGAGADARSPVGPIGSVDVAAPGFINIHLAPRYVESAVEASRAAGPSYGRVHADRPRQVNVEFVSANPTGPLHIGNARGAFVGDLLCRVLEASGQRVTREYYFNDFGAQILALGRSVLAVREGQPLPEDGYRGDYVQELARDVPPGVLEMAAAGSAADVGPVTGAAKPGAMGEEPEAGGARPRAGDAGRDAEEAKREAAGAGREAEQARLEAEVAEAGADAARPGAVPTSDPAWAVGLWASERVREGIESSLAHLGVHFDVWKSESSLYTEGWVPRAIDRLREAGYVYMENGATWFRSTDFGDDKDRVLLRSNGAPTYFASDVGYVTEKFSRGFDHLVYIWGQDHHGTVARVRNAAQAMGYERDSVEMLLIAWVRFVRDGVEVSMSKRAGEFITLDELLAEIGVDAARWFFAARGHTSAIDFDIELAKKQSNENPVFYVQYAHARISSILRKADEAGLTAADSLAGTLEDDAIAIGLAKLLLQLPEVVEDAAAAHETQGVTAYATELATVFHAYYRDRRVVDAADPATSAARLALVSAARQALANTLGLLGISAPESM